MADMIVQYAVRCHGEEAELMDVQGKYWDADKVLALIVEEMEICKRAGVAH